MRGLTRHLGVIAAVIAVIGILWIDIATGLWQEYVILAGLAAGVVTFVLTVLVVDRVMARSTHRRWAPVTRLALTDILHALADEEASEISRGEIVARTLRPVTDAAGTNRTTELARLRHDVVAERQHLTRALASWSSFLAASSDAGAVLDHAAGIAEHLDRVRDAVLSAESGASVALTLLDERIHDYNQAVRALVAELLRVIETTERLTSE